MPPLCDLRATSSGPARIELSSSVRYRYTPKLRPSIIMPAVLLALHDDERRRALHDVVAAAGYRVHLAASLDQARQVLAATHVDVAFLGEGLDAVGTLASELRRRQTTPRPRLVRVLDPNTPTPPPAATWRPDASLGGALPAETALDLLARLAPIARAAPPT